MPNFKLEKGEQREDKEKMFLNAENYVQKVTEL